MSAKKLNFCLTDHPDLLNDIYAEAEGVHYGVNTIFDSSSASIIAAARNFERLDIDFLAQTLNIQSEEDSVSSPKNWIHRFQLTPDYDWVNVWAGGKTSVHLVQSQFFYSRTFKQGSKVRTVEFAPSLARKHFKTNVYAIDQATLDAMQSSNLCSKALATRNKTSDSFFANKLFAALLPSFVIKQNAGQVAVNSAPTFSAYQIPSLRDFLRASLRAYHRLNVVNPLPSKPFNIDEWNSDEVSKASMFAQAYMDLVDIQLKPEGAFDVLSSLWGDKADPSFVPSGWLSEHPRVQEILSYAGKSTLFNFANETHQQWFGGVNASGKDLKAVFDRLDCKVGLYGFFKTSVFTEQNAVQSISYLGCEETEVYTEIGEVLSDDTKIVRCGNLLSFVTPEMRTQLKDALGLKGVELSSDTMAARFLPFQTVTRLHEQFYKKAVKAVASV